MQKLLIQAIVMMLSLLTPELLKKAADMVLDFAEDKILGSASEIDDKLVLPVIELIRETFNIPDDD
jgi:hypothetical protein